MAFFRDSWGGLLSTRPAKILILHLYLAYLGFAIWGCLNVKEGITLDKLAADDSYVADYYNQDIRHFRKYGHVVSVSVGKELELWRETERDTVDQLIQEFEKTDYFHGEDITLAWTRDFSTFVGSNDVDSRNFSETLHYFLSTYSRLGYNLDIKTDSDTVKYSRFFVHSRNMDTSIRESEMMLAARAIADNHTDLDVTVFHPGFIFFDQYLAVWPNTRQNLLIASAAMFVVSLFLIPHPVCSLWVTFSIVSICTGVIGYMTWWDVNLDTVSMINVIVCIGFCVDFSAHITYAFMSADGDTGNQRMRNALHAVGFPIAQGALSTLCGLIALAFSPSYIFRSFFKTMSLVIFLGAIHGLVIIPALLSVMGPPKRTKKRHSVSPYLLPVADGPDRWWSRRSENTERDRTYRAPVEYRSEVQHNIPVSRRKIGTPMRYCTALSFLQNIDRGAKPNRAPMPYANDDLPPRYETTEHRSGWTGGHGYWPSLSGRGRPEEKYIGPHEFVPPLSITDQHLDTYRGPHEHMPPKYDSGRRGANYSGRHDGGPPPSSDAPPPYQDALRGGHTMTSSWNHYR